MKNPTIASECRLAPESKGGRPSIGGTTRSHDRAYGSGSPVSRRNLLRACLRGGGLAALGGVAALLGWRATRDGCQRSHPCAACPLWSGCGLPPAETARKSPTHPNPASNHG
jgi:hypothetical protein